MKLFKKYKYRKVGGFVESLILCVLLLTIVFFELSSYNYIVEIILSCLDIAFVLIKLFAGNTSWFLLILAVIYGMRLTDGMLSYSDWGNLYSNSLSYMIVALLFYLMLRVYVNNIKSYIHKFNTGESVNLYFVLNMVLFTIISVILVKSIPFEFVGLENLINPVTGIPNSLAYYFVIFTVIYDCTTVYRMLTKNYLEY